MTALAASPCMRYTQCPHTGKRFWSLVACIIVVACAGGREGEGKGEMVQFMGFSGQFYAKFVGAFFLWGAFMEFTMIKTGFYDTAVQTEAERRLARSQKGIPEPVVKFLKEHNEPIPGQEAPADE
eukprot:CAMPEP_0114631122 /NCGR_PEP_ID=MMETSP0168-20121206/14244_1 /TAXON_ID=95228 ORGANISM="Vannella sp., Strain DIVA3 517/6/12" /NCGR_SAMPLE_ID=MMETSP0168 /ASSEMBLY_ACC=CAM_ASM_000044 /LENGTH=124 /DNA_ID=CAMNT_0001842667 /DNA_START=108 /DNA_END=482 /DNA_ORIENTATION=-